MTLRYRSKRTLPKPKPGLLLLILLISGCRSGPSLGTTAPDFDATDQAGHPASLAAYHDKVVIMYFWATWCPPCVTASPYIQRFHDDFADEQRVVVLGIHFDDQGDPAAYFDENGYTFPNVDDGREIVEAYGITRIPTILVIDRTGTIVHNQAGFAPGDDKKIAAVARTHQ